MMPNFKLQTSPRTIGIYKFEFIFLLYFQAQKYAKNLEFQSKNTKDSKFNHAFIKNKNFCEEFRFSSR